MPVFFLDNPPVGTKLALVTIKPFDIPEKTPYRSLERGVRAGTGKVSLDGVPFDDDAGGAALDQKIGHRIEICRARANRKSQPRLRHEFLCHRDKSGSNDEKIRRSIFSRLVKFSASRY